MLSDGNASQENNNDTLQRQARESQRLTHRLMEDYFPEFPFN